MTKNEIKKREIWKICDFWTSAKFLGRPAIFGMSKKVLGRPQNLGHPINFLGRLKSFGTSEKVLGRPEISGTSEKLLGRSKFCWDVPKSHVFVGAYIPETALRTVFE